MKKCGKLRKRFLTPFLLPTKQELLKTNKGFGGATGVAIFGPNEDPPFSQGIKGTLTATAQGSLAAPPAGSLGISVELGSWSTSNGFELGLKQIDTFWQFGGTDLGAEVAISVTGSISGGIRVY